MLLLGFSLLLLKVIYQFCARSTERNDCKDWEQIPEKVYVQAQLCTVSRSITVSGISKHYDTEFLSLYFDNPRKSGGRDVESVECLGNGEAVITFKDPQGKYNILSACTCTCMAMCMHAQWLYTNFNLKHENQYGEAFPTAYGIITMVMLVFSTIYMYRILHSTLMQGNYDCREKLFPEEYPPELGHWEGNPKRYIFCVPD